MEKSEMGARSVGQDTEPDLRRRYPRWRKERHMKRKQPWIVLAVVVFGHAPGEWLTLKAKLGRDQEGNERLGRKSVWRVGTTAHGPDFPECGNLLRARAVWSTGPVLKVTQVVEIVRGPLTGKLDTCR